MSAVLALDSLRCAPPRKAWISRADPSSLETAKYLRARSTAFYRHWRRQTPQCNCDSRYRGGEVRFLGEVDAASQEMRARVRSKDRREAMIAPVC